MDNNRLKRILTIVDTAISMKPEQRSGYLTEVCGDDESLRNEVTDLLKSIDKSEEFWEGWQDWNEGQIQKLFGEEGKDFDAEPDHAGPWRLIRLLGRGGMGDVFLAERADGQYEQQAAVKILGRGLGHSESVRRFEQERQILARLDHPNIARFYDGGITNDDRPWLAMQYVDGIPITEWCRQEKITFDDRLDLFENVCEAVRYAHTNLIVHRDLKPENILVSGEGLVKVLDFGIAKLVDEELTETERLRTQTGLRVMSLDYAAPEQIVGEPVTTATDVYALGLLLFEILTGTYPFDLEEKNQRQAEQILRTRDPQKPSSVAGRWQAQLKGDLDAIVLKALRKEPDRRYENAGQLLDDLRRYRDNLPVAAQRDTLHYRINKFYKRHRRAIFAGAAVIIGVIALVSYYTFRITEERNSARQEAAKAQEISSFLQNLFDSADPNIALGDEVTARQMLDRGAERIRTELAGQPALQVELMDVIGPIYNRLGLYDEGLRMARDALEIKQSVQPENQTEIAQSLNGIGASFTYMGEYDSAAVYFNRTLDLTDQLNPSDETASALHSFGAVNYHQQRYELADSLYQAALAMRTDLHGEEHEDVARTMDALGILREMQDRTDEAEELMKRALEIRTDILGKHHPDVSISKNSLAVLYLNSNRVEEAIPLLHEVLEMRRDLFGADHPRVAAALNNLGAAYKQNGEFEEAVSYYNRALDVRRRVLGENHPDVGYTMCATALTYYEEGDKASALPLFQGCLDIFEQTLRPAHGLIVKSKGLLGDCLVEQRDFQRAETLLLDAYQTGAAEYGEEHGEILTIKRFLVNLYTEWGKPELAVQYQQTTE